MGQHMVNIKEGKRVSENGYESLFCYYQAKRCQGCPYLNQHHKAQWDKAIEINHRLNELKQKA